MDLHGLLQEYLYLYITWPHCLLYWHIGLEPRPQRDGDGMLQEHEMLEARRQIVRAVCYRSRVLRVWFHGRTASGFLTVKIRKDFGDVTPCCLIAGHQFFGRTYCFHLQDAGSNRGTMNITVFWDIEPCCLVDTYRHVWGTCCLQIWDTRPMLVFIVKVSYEGSTRDSNRKLFISQINAFKLSKFAKAITSLICWIWGCHISGYRELYLVGVWRWKSTFHFGRIYRFPLQLRRLTETRKPHEAGTLIVSYLAWFSILKMEAIFLHSRQLSLIEYSRHIPEDRLGFERFPVRITAETATNHNGVFGDSPRPTHLIAGRVGPPEFTPWLLPSTLFPDHYSPIILSLGAVCSLKYWHCC
jgi:hypothetical protein